MARREATCPECKTGTMKRAAHNMRVKVADRAAHGTAMVFPKCDACGYYELEAKQMREAQRRAALVVLNDADTVSGAVLKFARKTLGLKQSELAELLDYDLATVSRYENNAREPRGAYRFALMGLLTQ